MNRLDGLNEEIRTVFKKTMPMIRLTPEENAKHAEAMHCYCCNQLFNSNDRQKVRDHCHITGKYRGAACKYCNFKHLDIVANHHTIPIVFHNLKGYDMHHILKNLDGRNTSIIANSKEKIMTARIRDQSEEYEEDRNTNSSGIKYIDSFQFLSTSLATLADNLPKEDYIYMEKYLHDDITQKQ